MTKSDAGINQAVKLYLQGETLHAIARQLDWNIITVRKYLKARNVYPLSSKHRRKAVIHAITHLDKIHARYTQGELLVDIANEYDISHSHLYKLLKSQAEANSIHRTASYNARRSEFVAAWQSSNSTTDVMRQLNMRRQAVLQRASRYRRAGIQQQIQVL